MARSRSDDTFRGASNLRFNRTIKDAVGQRDKVDFYKFKTSRLVDFSATLKGLKADATLRLFNQKRKQIAISKNPGQQTEEILQTLDRGTYYLQVQIVGRRGNTRYNLRASAPAAEPGETPATARNVGSLSGDYRIREFVGSTDPSDYYKFTLAEISIFNANILGSSADADLDLYYDANNNGLLDSGEFLDDGGNGDNISRTMLDGTYFVIVQTFGSTQYDLLLSATPDPSNLTQDPGNLTPDALNLGNVTTAALKDFVGAFDDRDYYKFTLSQISNFSANITGFSASTDLDLYYDANNNGFIDSGEFLDDGGDGDNISRPILPGTYFLDVQSFGSTRYDLNVSVTPDPSNLPRDPGNTTLEAYTLSSASGTQSIRDFVGEFDSLDYYKLTFSSSRSLSASIAGLSATTDLDLYYDANNNGLIDSGEFVDDGGDGDNIAETLAPGSYFLAVQTFGSATRYNLTLVLS